MIIDHHNICIAISLVCHMRLTGSAKRQNQQSESDSEQSKRANKNLDNADLCNAGNNLSLLSYSLTFQVCYVQLAYIYRASQKHNLRITCQIVSQSKILLYISQLLRVYDFSYVQTQLVKS